MSSQTRISAAIRATASETRALKAFSNNTAANRVSDESSARLADQDDFAKLIQDLKGATEEARASSAATSSQWWQGDEPVPVQLHQDVQDDVDQPILESSDLMNDADEDKESVLDKNTEEFSLAGDFMNAAMNNVDSTNELPQAGGTESSSASKGSSSASETAALILEQMQTRALLGESRHWEFTLPGLLEGSVVVTVDRLENHSWLVELSSNDECSDDEALALEHQLAERLGDVSVSTRLL